MPNTPCHDLVLVRVHGTALSAPCPRFTGVVEAVGRNVTGFVPGDEVCGTAERMFGEYVCIPQRDIKIIQED